MRQLPLRAQVWIAVTLACGLAALAPAVRELVSGGGPAWGDLPWLTFLVFLGLCSLGHAFPVVAPRHQAYHTTQTFLMAALLLLPWPMVAAIVLMIHAAEWLRRRRPWYIQLYNTASYLLSAGAGYLVLASLGQTGGAISLVNGTALGAAVGTALVYLVANHALTAAVLWCARGVTPASSGLFGVESLGVDGALLALGIPMAAGWRQQPFSLLVTAAPLWLVYRALQVPGLEDTSHRDRISGLYNRRHLVEALDMELRRAQRRGDAVSVLVGIVDDEEECAARYGQATLDFLLVAVGERIARLVREYDVIARLDRVAFGVLLSATDGAEAEKLGQRLARELAARPYPLATTQQPVTITASVAVATAAPGTPIVAADLLARLERAAQHASLGGQRALVTVEVAAGPGEAAQVPADALAASVEQPRRSPASSSQGYPRWALPVLQTAVTLPGVLLALAVLARSVPAPGFAFEFAGLTVALVGVAELLSFELNDRSTFSVNFAPMLAAMALLGPAGAVIGAWTAAVVRGGLRRSRWNRVLFNGSVYTLFGLLAASLFQLSGASQSMRLDQLGWLAVITLAASALYYGHTLLIASAIALDARLNVWSVWRNSYQWLFPHYLVLGIMGLGLAVATDLLGWLGTALFFAPPLAMRLVLKQYTDRTSAAVNHLEVVNSELAAVSEQLRQRGEDLALLSDVGQLLASEAGPAELPRLVVERCVPALGSACVILARRQPSADEVAIATDPSLSKVGAALATASVGELAALGREVAEAGGDHTLSPEAAFGLAGRWQAAELRGHADAPGWLLVWQAEAAGSLPRDAARQLELVREIARRLSLALEHDALLQEAVTADALRALDGAKSEFIATAAHELRTPLTSLQGYAELLRDTSVDPALRDRWLAIVNTEAAQLGLYLDQLLDVSKLETGRFQAARTDVSLDDLLDRVLSAFAVQAELTRHQFERRVERRLPSVHVDPTQLERVLRNLLSNALKYSPAGGPVRVSAWRASESEVELTVTDEGLGVPEEWLERVFERFQRVDAPERAAIRGTGLGLYITRQLVELNGGKVWLSSAGAGRGTTVHVTLPVRATSAVDAPASDSYAPASP